MKSIPLWALCILFVSGSVFAAPPATLDPPTNLNLWWSGGTSAEADWDDVDGTNVKYPVSVYGYFAACKRVKVYSFTSDVSEATVDLTKSITLKTGTYSLEDALAVTIEVKALDTPSKKTKRQSNGFASCTLDFPDAIDGDCDGDTDSDAFHPDADEDGYGSAAVTVYSACASPSGYATDGTDCNDADDLIYPGADPWQHPAIYEGVCNDYLDVNCDGYNDSQSGTCTECTGVDFYWDNDGDGYGGAFSASLCALEGPAGTVANGDDPDDSDCADPDPDGCSQ